MILMQQMLTEKNLLVNLSIHCKNQWQKQRHQAMPALFLAFAVNYVNCFV